MGGANSVLVVEQDSNSYQNHDIVNSFSNESIEGVLTLYKIYRFERNENFVEESLLSNEYNSVDIHSYAIVLINQNNPSHCFSVSRYENEDDAKKSFKDLSSLLFPFVDHYPSIHKSDLLQSLIKLKKAYPTWTDLRIAEYLKLPEIKTRNVPVAKYARQNSQHQQETIGLVLKEKPSFAKDLFGSIPLPFLTEKHPELFESIVSAVDSIHKTGKDFKDSLDGITKYTESPIHVAVRLSQDSALKMLLEQGANHLIPCGHAYPIHLAMKHESKGCLMLLLQHDVDCMQLKDKKYLGSPLHWSKNSDQIDILADMKNIDFNVGNVSNETALHIMVQRKRLSPAISLVCHGADIDAVAANGQTPLHYAVLQGDINIIKALLILGADPKIKDGKKKTAFEYANVSSHNFGEIEELFQLFQSNDSVIPGYRSKERERTQSILKEKTGKESVLTLDGGGIRGLILTEILIALESITNQPLYNLFDWVSGTSTGSFLAMSLSNGKTLRHCQRAYLRLGRSCFTGVRPYPTERVDQFLMDEFGEDTKMNCFQYPKMIIPAVMADRRPAMLHLFRNYDAPYDGHYQLRDARFPRPPVPADQLMWLAIRSSCSAPSYFRSTGRYIDGGLIANNPTLDVLSEIHNYRKHYADEDVKKQSATDLKVVVSVGTGRMMLNPIRPIDLYRPSSVWDTPEVVDNLKGFVDLLVDQVSASDNHVMERARCWCEMINVDYVRFNPFLSTDVELNEIDDKILLPMIIGVKKYIQKNFEELERIGRILLGEEK